MKEYVIDLAGVCERKDLHRRLRESLPLPSWYGDNLDALYDALTDMTLPVCLRFTNWELLQKEESVWFENLRRLLRDIEDEVPGFSVVFEGAEGGSGEVKGKESPQAEAVSAENSRAEDGSGESAPAATTPAERIPAGDVSAESARAETVSAESAPAKSGPGRTLIITDLHGCLDECLTLLEKMRFDEERDTLINLGDTIDRGPQIYETFEYLRGLKDRMGDRCVLICGNHEQMMLDAMDRGGRDKDLWYYNSGEKTVFSFIHHKHRIQEYLAWYRQMPYYYVTPDFNCVHASLQDPDPAANPVETLIWGRDTAYSGKLVLTGHTPYRAPIYFLGDQYGKIQEDVWTHLPETGMIALDTGCVYGNRLTGMIIRDDRTFLVTSVASNVK